MIGTGLGLNIHRRRYGGDAAFANTHSVFFAGGNEAVEVNAVQTALALTTVGTISGWIKPTDSGVFGIFLSFGDTSHNEFLYLSISAAAKFSVACRLVGINQWVLDTTNAVFSSGVWNHFAIVQDATESKLYIDGVFIAQSFTVSTNKTRWLNDLPNLDNSRLGCLNFNSGGNQNFYDGNIDEILYINRVLSQPQVADIYNGGVPKDETGIANGVTQFRIDGDLVGTGCIDFIDSNNGSYINVIQSEIQTDVP